MNDVDASDALEVSVRHHRRRRSGCSAPTSPGGALLRKHLVARILSQALPGPESESRRLGARPPPSSRRSSGCFNPRYYCCSAHYSGCRRPTQQSGETRAKSRRATRQSPKNTLRVNTSATLLAANHFNLLYIGVSTGEQKPAAEDTEKRHQCSSLPPGKDTGRRLQKTKIGRPKMSTGMGL